MTSTLACRLLLATSNAAKVARLHWVVDGLGYSIVTPRELGLFGAVEVPETGSDFAANAARKAIAWSCAADGMPALATDGGLAIPALGVAWSALTTKRNAGEAADDADRAQHLLELMQGLHGEDRRAIWHEAVALKVGDAAPLIWRAEGDGGFIVETYNADTSRTGFWTESLRYYPAAGKLYRDLDTEQLEQLGSAWPPLRTAIRACLIELTQAPEPERAC